MKLRPGFSFIEVITSVLISSIIGLVLFQTLFQFSKALNFVDTTATVQTDKLLLDRQWDRDFSGMLAPHKKKPEVRDQEGQPKENKQALTEEPQKKKDKTEEEKFHADPFVYTAEADGAVTMISCITSNPALMYGNLLPRIVRVVYRVVPSKTQEGIYTLLRQQSEDLELSSFSNTKEGKVRAYELVSGIKKIKLEAWVEKTTKKETTPPQQPNQQSSQTTQKKEQEKPEPRVFVPWQEWQKIDKEEKKKFELALVPTFIKITVIFVHGTKEKEHVFWYAPAYDNQPVIIEGPSLLLTDRERSNKKYTENQYGKINEQLQDFNERVLSKKMVQK